MELITNRNDQCTSISIKPINDDTVHKICSGQVVLNLATTVKELVENSLDAEATVVDVRLKNYGVDLIEVSDNGTGVVEDNFAALTQKYYTSKLNDYSDLLGVSSFGFRGEALSSLCALANLTITTRHTSANYASKIDYDHKGNVVKITHCSRQIGTTVTLTNLFSSLPVRQKEFHKNAKREFNKMTQLLYSYCLISLGVKIICTNTTSPNTKSVVVATHGSNLYKDNIACVFGSKQLQSILELKPEFTTNIKDNIFKGLMTESQETNEIVDIDDVTIDLSEDSNDAEEDNLTNSQKSLKSQGHTNKCPVDFTGFISSCAHGSGRSSTDRQFYYVNSRPCEPPKIIKLINDVYKQYNPHQYPFVFLNINLDRATVDVNVTPDKRKVFLTKEKIILDVIKASLARIFEDIPRTLRVEGTDKLMTSQEKHPDLSQPRIFNSFIKKFAKSDEDIEKKENELKTVDLKRKSTTMLNFVSTKAVKIETHDSIMNIEINSIENGSENPEGLESNIKEEYIAETANETEYTIQKSEFQIRTDIKSPQSEVEYESDLPEHKEESERKIVYLESTDNLPQTQIRQLEDVIEESHTICKTNTPKQKAPVKRHPIIVTDKEDIGVHKRRTVKLNTCISHVQALHAKYLKQNKRDIPNRIKFRSQINPVFNSKCEEELSREISKTSFKEMAVVGQFNLGFIITRLDEDLFIIDQHATDEIYNFETLQRTTELTSQKLVVPQQLELTGVNEQILMDNLQIFKKNGFTFEINHDAEPTKRVKLLTLPMSKNWIFGKEDIEELLFMLRVSCIY